MEVNTAPNPIVEIPLPPTQTPKEQFEEGLKKLSDDTGMRLQVSPQFVLRDDGTFSLIVTTDVVPVS